MNRSPAATRERPRVADASTAAPPGAATPSVASPVAPLLAGHSWNGMSVSRQAAPAPGATEREAATGILQRKCDTCAKEDDERERRPAVMRAPEPGAAEASAPATAPPPPQAAPPPVELKTPPGASGSTTFTLVNKTRSVSGPTLSAVGTAATANGAREAASVKPVFAPAPQYEFDDEDRVTKATIRVEETKEMPVWAERDAQCAPIQAEWDRFRGVLDAHENNHVAIDRKHFEGLHLRTLGKKSADAYAVVDAAIDAADKANEAYDAQTKHGLTEGTAINGAVQCGMEKVQSSVGGADGTQETSLWDDVTGAVGGLFAKREVSEPGDPLEREADEIADRVMRTSNGGAGAVGVTPLAFTVLPRCACHDEERKDEAPVRRREAGDAAPPTTRGAAPHLVDEVLSGGAGRPLAPDVRQFMEPRFGHDFSAVRIHTDARASESARAVQARAYAVGGDVVFREGEYAPDTTAGKRLLAHELVHVVQQGAARPGASDAAVLRDPAPPAPSAAPVEGDAKAQIEEAIKEKSVRKINAMDKRIFPQATVSQRLDMILILLNQWYVAFYDEVTISYIWGSFGKSLPAIASQYYFIWVRCMEQDDSLLTSLPDLLNLKAEFRLKVAERARGYLTENRELVKKERQKMGVDQDAAADTPDQKKAQGDIKVAAQHVEQAQKAMDKMKSMPCLYHWTRDAAKKRPEKFDPDRSAEFNTIGDESVPPDYDGPPLQTHEELSVLYKRAQGIIDNYTKQYPTLFALVRDGKSHEVAEGGAGATKTVIGKALSDTLDNIGKAEGMLGDPKGEFAMDLQPIHQQLFASDKTWSQPLHKDVAKATVAEHDSKAFRESMGLAGVGMALMAVATLTTGGLATFFLVAAAGTGVATAAQSWDKYLNLAAAGGANLSKESALVSQGQVDEALMSAMLDSIFAVVDVVGAGRAVSAEFKGLSLAQREAKIAEMADKQIAKVEQNEANAALREAFGVAAKTGEKNGARRTLSGIADAFEQGVTHKFILTEDGRLFRCTFCEQLSESLRGRVNALTGGQREALSAGKLAEFEAMIGEANGLVNEARTAAGLAEGAERVAKEDELFKKLANLENRFKAVEKAAGRPRIFIPKSAIDPINAARPKIGDNSWDFAITATVDGEKATLGLISAPVDPATGLLHGPPTFALNTRVTVGGREIIVNIEGGESLTRMALAETIAAHRRIFGSELASLGGTLAEKNLLNFQREFALARSANPALTEAQLAQEAIRKISFGSQRVAEGFSEFGIQLGKTVTRDLGEGIGEQVVPGLVEVVAKRPAAAPPL